VQRQVAAGLRDRGREDLAEAVEQALPPRLDDLGLRLAYGPGRRRAHAALAEERELVSEVIRKSGGMALLLELLDVT
jgi:hypothetical protein